MQITLVVVADGAQANIFVQEAPHGSLRLIDTLASDLRGLKSHDLVTDRPGREFSRMSSNRSSLEAPIDPLRYAKKEFARRVARLLEREQDRFDHLVLAAPSKTLGDLRENLSARVAGKIMAELHKDLTHLSAFELTRHLADTIGFQRKSFDPVKQRRYPSLSA